MLAKLIIQCCVLDYTTIPAPLTFDAIYEDINTCCADDFAPEKIIVWQHQWDWLVKSIPTHRVAEAYIASAVKAPATIWGVPVEVKS
jgi:hypothetical protein